MSIWHNLITNADMFHATDHYVAELLERGVRVLIYVGAIDWSCNVLGQEKWTQAMVWNGQKKFSEQPLRAWEVDGKSAGVTKSVGPLTYATIDGAGHLVCGSS